MDKVGPYEGANKVAHRALEMGIDVLLCKHFTEPSGASLEASFLGMDTSIKGFNGLRYAESVRENFANLISEIYGQTVALHAISEWVLGLARLFCLSTGQWPQWFRDIGNTEKYVFRQFEDLKGRENDYLLLEKPKYWDLNFRRKPQVHLIEECLPRFNTLIRAFLEKAFAYVYNTGAELSEDDLPAFSLDTGRPVTAPSDTSLEPVLWRAS
jgi:hypothetical protein